MSDQWYYVLGSETHGPHSRRELQGLAQAGKIQSATLVWREGMDDWSTAAALFPKTPAVTPPPVPPPVSSTKTAPPPPARLTVPPPRPTSRPSATNSQNSLLAAVAGIALVAGLAIGWLAHAMWMRPGDQGAVVAASVPSQSASQSSRPAVRSAAVAKSPAPAAVASPVVTRAAALAKSAAIEPSVSDAPLPANPSPAVVASSAGEKPAVTAPSPPVSLASDTNPPPPPAASSSAAQPSRAQAAPPLYQEIDVQRAPKFAVAGFVTAQEVRYQLLSELRVGEPDEEGIRTVAQTVVDTKLVAADALSQPMFEASLKKIKGWQFSYTLSKEGEVLKMMAGPADAPKAAKVEPMGGKGFFVTSVMDEAGWKELAQLSFYVPDEQASGNRRELRQMTHDFGPLGSFAGETSFVRKGTQQGLLRIDYAHKLTYRGPGKDAPGDLPFAVKGAELRPDIAGGSIWYDMKAKRVRQAEDHFRVKGEIAAEVAGMPVGVQIEEGQAIAVRIADQNPWSK